MKNRIVGYPLQKMMKKLKKFNIWSVCRLRIQHMTDTIKRWFRNVPCKCEIWFKRFDRRSNGKQKIACRWIFRTIGKWKRLLTKHCCWIWNLGFTPNDQKLQLSDNGTQQRHWGQKKITYCQTTVEDHVNCAFR